MEKLELSHGVAVQWRSFELRPKDSPPPSPEYLAKIEANRPRIYEMAREQYGLEMNPGPFGLDSRPALISAKYAEAEGYGRAFHGELMRGYWLNAEDISNREVLANAAGRIEMSRDGLLSALDEPRYVEAVEQEKAQAHAYGLDAVPAMIFAAKYLVSGAQPYEVLTDVVERIRRLGEGNHGAHERDL